MTELSTPPFLLNF